MTSTPGRNMSERGLGVFCVCTKSLRRGVSIIKRGVRLCDFDVDADAKVNSPREHRAASVMTLVRPSHAARVPTVRRCDDECGAGLAVGSRRHVLLLTTIVLNDDA